MSKIIPYRPKHEFEAEKNVLEFIEHCKLKLNLYGEDMVWDAPKWNVTDRHRRRGQGNTHAEMVFSSLGSSRRNAIPMHKEYVDFSRAYVLDEMSNTGAKDFCNALIATRILEKALISCSRDCTARVHFTDESVAIQGVKIIEEHYPSLASRYTYGCGFQKLIRFLVKKLLVIAPFEWKCPIPPPPMGDLVGEEHDKKRASKLPSRETLAAVGTIFDSATETGDIIVSSCIALLCSAPGRVCEIVTMQNECEEWLNNGDGTKDLSLRWYPAKNGTKGLKDILKEMEPIALKALEKVRAITMEGRNIARWYEKYPDRIYLPEEMEHLRQKEIINGEELAQIFGLKTGGSSKIVNRHQLTIFKKIEQIPGRLRKDGTRAYYLKAINMYSFAEVENAVLGYLTPEFPWLDKENGVKYSDALFVVPRGTFSNAEGAMPCMFMGVNLSLVLNYFAGAAGRKNIFFRNGFTNPGGTQMRMPTHQSRHWLNTIAERAGLSDLERDMWSGRTTSKMRNGEQGPTSRQSQTYLHNTVEELMVAADLKAEDMNMGASFAAVVGNLPVSREEFALMEDKPTVHVTEYGICFHDYAMQTCQVHADCLNCMEHAFIKGESKKAERIRECHSIAVEQLVMAKQMVEEKYLKAEPWYLHQALTVKRLIGLLGLLDDDSLPPDTIIMLTNPFQYSAFRNAIEERATNLGDISSITLAEAFKVPLLSLVETLSEVTHGAFV